MTTGGGVIIALVKSTLPWPRAETIDESISVTSKANLPMVEVIG